MTQDLFTRFQSKTDFISYMTNQLQLYVPPEKMLNRDFMKQLLLEAKKFLELSVVRFVHVPAYDELSVKKFWPLMQQNAVFMQYMPDPTADGRLPEREYFWNVLNTLQTAYVQRLIEHANAQRNTLQEDEDGGDAIEISDEWWRKLNALPFVSQTKGKTLHLLKKQSKPVPQHRKRVKRDIFASPADFQRLHADFAGAGEEQKHEEPEEQAQLHCDMGYVPADGGPNQIGNVEDGPVEPDNVQAAAQYVGTPQSVHSASASDGRAAGEDGGDVIMYTPIAPTRTEAQLAMRASRRTKSKERPP